MSKTNHNSGSVWLLPGEVAWSSRQVVQDKWAVTGWDATQVGPVPRGVAIPSAALNIVCLWAPPADEAIHQELMEAHCERLGIRGKIQVARLGEENSEVLLRGTCLSEEEILPEESRSAQLFVPAFSLLNWDGSGFLLCTELGRWVAYAVRRGWVVASNDFAEDTPLEVVAQHLGWMHERLISEGLAEEEVRFAILEGPSVDWGVKLVAAFYAAASAQPPEGSWVVVPWEPPPMLSKDSGLIPAAAIAERRRVKKKQGQARGVKVALAAAAIFVAVYAGGWVQKWVELRNLERQQAEGQGSVAELRAAFQDWQKVAPAIELERQAVEMLRRVASHRSAEIKLSLFEVEEEVVRIRGESPGAPQAFQFSEAMRADPALGMIEWDEPRTNFRPDNTAQFDLRGTFLP